MRSTEKRIKVGGTVLCELFTVFTILSLWSGDEPDRMALAFGTLLLVLLPLLVEKIFDCRISLPVYLFALAYAVGPMLGHCWKLYYTVPVWDKLLHISGGVMFAILGVYIFAFLTEHKESALPGVLFAFCFSVAISALWEFAEFGADRFLGMDMQDDTLVTHITSYLLGEGIGNTGSIENIRSVTVDGIVLPGYIDIGLTDSMLDMMLETLGALITCLLIWFDKGKHCLIRREAAGGVSDQ